jgi:hypothetical protein
VAPILNGSAGLGLLMLLGLRWKLGAL